MILAFDLGTSGAKVCVFDESGRLHAKTFRPYGTEYPAEGFHVQDPGDWWEAVSRGTSELVSRDISLKNSIRAIAISGQSLAVVPLDSGGRLLFNDIPIWSDTRAEKQCARFFESVDKQEWYLATGNGFTPSCYSLFKIMWYRDNFPEKFGKIKTVLGSKDYINFILTGNYATDYSYASGSGAYSLLNREYIKEYFDAAGIDAGLLPEPCPSHQRIGNLKREPGAALGLAGSVEVFCGGVDNSCMALGARNTTEGKVYLSLGSSAWIAVSSEKPLVDREIKPFIFDHVIPDMYTSATSIFSAGSSLKWFRQNIAFGLESRALSEDRDIYDLITEEASKSGPGAGGVYFNPTLAGSPEASEYTNITGAFLNLRLGSSFSDLGRAVLEGITFELSAMWRRLNQLCSLSQEVVIVGGGSRSAFWRQMFADVFGCNFSRISTDQDAAAFGAAAIAAVGSGIWQDFPEIEAVIRDLETVEPDERAVKIYKDIYEEYSSTRKMLSEIGDVLNRKRMEEKG